VQLIQRVADWGFEHGGDQLAEGLVGTGALVVFALVCVLQILATFKVREGLHGARVLLAILALPGMLLGTTVVATSGTMGGLVGTVSLMAVPFLWTEKPQAWFRFHRDAGA
jgi:acetyl-CoA carboxylase carboxyltransferase component